MKEQLNKLNCMNYHVQNSKDDFWYAQNGLRSLWVYSKESDTSFRELCLKMLEEGQVIVKDLRDNDNERFIITMI
jgi:hypothetical protein